MNTPSTPRRSVSSLGSWPGSESSTSYLSTATRSAPEWVEDAVMLPAGVADHGGDVLEEPGPVQGLDLDPHHEGAGVLGGPGDFHRALPPLVQRGDIGAVGAVHRDPPAHRHIANDRVAGDR